MWEFLQVQFGISFVGYQVYLVYLLALIAYHDKSGPDMGMEFFLMPSGDHINKGLHIVRYVNTNLNSKIGYDGKQQEGFIAYCRNYTVTH